MVLIPPVGTSAYKAYNRQFDILNPKTFSSGNGSSGVSGSFNKLTPPTSIAGRLFSTLPDSPVKDTLVEVTEDAETSAKRLPKSTKRVSSSSGGGAPSAAALEYLNADLAKYYGMDVTTAYNEALSNTAYQRAVKDMQAAGLNPAVLFGNGRVSGADGVYGAKPLSAASGGSSGRSYGRRGSGKLFSSSTYAMISGLGSLAGAAIAAVTGGSVGIGALTGGNIATSAAKVLNGLSNKR